MAKATPKLFIADERMLKLMEYVIGIKMKGVDTQSAFCDVIGVSKTAIPNVRDGRRGFTPEQHLAVANFFGVDLNWLYGKSKFMFNRPSADPIKLLRDIAYALEVERERVGGNNTPYRKGKKSE